MTKRNLPLAARAVLSAATIAGLLPACGTAQSDGNVERTARAEGAVTQTVTQTRHKYGAILETPEQIQSKLLTVAPRALAAQAAAALPTSVDLSSKLPPVGDQGSLGSCVGFAVAYATKTFQEVVEMKWLPDATDHEFSPSWIYNQLCNGSPHGIGVGDALNLVVTKGCDTVSSFPYNQNDWTTQPNANSMSRAAHYRAKSYNPLTVSSDNIRTILAGGNVVVAAFNVLPDLIQMNGTTNTVYDDPNGTEPVETISPCPSDCTSICNSSTACGTCNTTTNVCTVPACNTPPCVLGGHAVAIVGYDDNAQKFKFINSWGASWNGNGYGWLPYSFITNAWLGMGAYVLIDGPNVPGLQDSTMTWFESAQILLE
jgi:C1A family cysteine protease